MLSLKNQSYSVQNNSCLKSFVFIFECSFFLSYAEKDKNPYTRQQSAPQFRRRGSRFGMGMFSNYMFPGKLACFVVTDQLLDNNNCCCCLLLLLLPAALVIFVIVIIILIIV